MKNFIISTLSSLFSHYVGPMGADGGNADVEKLRMSLMYVKSVKTLRLLVIALVSLGVCLMLLMAGFIFFALTLLFFTPLTMEAKMYIGFACAALLCATAAFIFQRAFSQDKWLEMFHAREMLD